MKGVVLAGGTGSRLDPLTKSINKHCLPVYDRPMVYYPIQSLVDAGITDIILVTGGSHMNQFIDLLGDGSELGCTLTYVCQMEPGGIAEALLLTENHIGNDDVCVILGDNIFEENIGPFLKHFLDLSYGRYDGDFISKCHVICKPVDEPQHYGVLTDDGVRIRIIEKPKSPKSDLCVTGLYFYTSDVFDNIRSLEYSSRGELEVTDLNNIYAKTANLSYSITTKAWWDCGIDIDHMLQVSNEVKECK